MLLLPAPPVPDIVMDIGIGSCRGLEGLADILVYEVTDKEFGKCGL